MDELTSEYTNTQQIPQPLDVKNIIYKDKNAFIIECAMRLFVNVNFDVSGQSVTSIANDCIGKASVLYKSLHKSGAI